MMEKMIVFGVKPWSQVQSIVRTTKHDIIDMISYD